MNNNLMMFEGNDVEVFELNGQVLFNPKHVAGILGITDIKSSIRNFNKRQVVKVKKFRCAYYALPKIKQCRRKFSY